MRTECTPKPMRFARLKGRDVVADFGGGAMTSDAGAIEALFVDLFLDAHEHAPEQLVLDLDATDDPLHGRQEGRFFHGYYDCYCYLPLYIFCGDPLLAVTLRRSDIDASAGAVGEVERIVGQIHARWPAVEIVLRADSGVAREPLMAWCEDNAVDDVFGLARNARLAARLQPALDRAAARSRESGQPARLFTEFRYRTLKTWSRRRRVVGKAEWLPGRTNPRVVVTSLSPAVIDRRNLYETLYCARGEMETRIKECQLDRFADRTSATAMRANQLRFHGLCPAHRPQTHRARRNPPRQSHMRLHPPQAPQDRHPAPTQRKAYPHRHGVRLSPCRYLRTGTRPIMNLTPAPGPQPNPPDNNRNTAPEHTAPPAPARSLRAQSGDAAMTGSLTKPLHRLPSNMNW